MTPAVTPSATPSEVRVLFAGTPETAVPSLDALVRTGFTVAAVLTRPDAPVGRRRVLTPSPVAARALELGIPVLYASRLGGDAGRETLERIAALDLDVAAVVAYGALVPAAGLALPRHGWLNLHFSLLPAYRGAAPVQHAVIHGERRTGACVFQLEEGLDTGPVYARLERDLDPSETSGGVLADLAVSGAELLARTVADVVSGAATPEAQVGEPSFAPKLGQADGFIDPSQTAAKVVARINGTTPEPGAWAWLEGSGEPVRVKLLGAEPEAGAGSAPSDGADRAARADAAVGDLIPGRRSVHLRCADAVARLTRVQPAGKRPMAAADWARGLPAGARFRTRTGTVTGTTSDASSGTAGDQS